MYQSWLDREFAKYLALLPPHPPVRPICADEPGLRYGFWTRERFQPVLGRFSHN